MRSKVYPALLISLLALAGCDPARVYDDNRDLTDNIWREADRPGFDFEITDPTPAYTVYINVRNAPFYPFYNLFTSLRITAPNGATVSHKLHEMKLMDPATGEPLGKGMGDIYDHQFVALRHVRFPQKGTYHAQLTQYMRVAQLNGIMSVGVRVEREATTP